jgi:hypothetical protein
MTRELIQKARQTNLGEYLINSSVSLEKHGDRYRHAEHDSLTFHENSYYWNSRQEHGNAIDYLVRYMNMDFKQTVTALTESAGARDERPPSMDGDFKRDDLLIIKDISKVRAYLSKTRHIGNSIIDYLVRNKLLFQEKRTNNAVFPMYDENNDLVGAELQGIIPDKRFKGVQKDSKYGYGFNIKFFNDNNAFDYSLFFESAVDLISFVDYKLNREKKDLKGCILVSMAGLKLNILRHTAKAFQGDLKAVLCVDNDQAGQEFKNKVQQSKIPFIVSAPDERFKDWNEQLTAWHGNGY